MPVAAPTAMSAHNLELGVVGNCAFSALVDRFGRVVWSCWPRFDGDPVFCDLLRGGEARAHDRRGFLEIDLEGVERCEQRYLTNTAVLETRLFDGSGNGIEIVDFAPRFRQFGRTYRPNMLVRSVRPLSGTPRIVVRVRPSFDYGATEPEITHGSNHVRYVGPEWAMRLTTDAAASYVLAETPFFLMEPVHLILGPDESLRSPVATTVRDFQEQTEEYWRNWVRGLYIPLEWQDAVIRAAITLKLCSFEETGAIVAAMTTSVPEHADSGRNWDYRYCWLRDGFFVVRALSRLGTIETMENFLRYLTNIVASVNGGHLQPVYGIALEDRLVEREVAGLDGYRGMGPVRVGNQAYEHLQHDVYGNVVLATTQSFFDRRLLRPPGMDTYRRLEAVGERAYRLHDQPDAGMWELRTRARVHTSSSLMCWAACDRLAKIARKLGLAERGEFWQKRADRIHETICTRAWNDEIGAFAESFGGEDIDAGLLLMAEVGFLHGEDRRFRQTVDAVGRRLRRGNHLMRYHAADDFGRPATAFNICTFWYIEALDMIGRRDEAREIFESILACRTRLGLLSEDTDIATGEPWGNFPQTYSLVGIINCAMRLSENWREVI